MVMNSLSICFSVNFFILYFWLAVLLDIMFLGDRFFFFLSACWLYHIHFSGLQSFCSTDTFIGFLLSSCCFQNSVFIFDVAWFDFLWVHLFWCLGFLNLNVLPCTSPIPIFQLLILEINFILEHLSFSSFSGLPYVYICLLDSVL